MPDTPTPDAPTRRRSLISKPALRRAILEYAADNRAHRFTRVDPAVHEQAERQLAAFIQRLVESQPSAGKTIRPA